MPKTRENKYYMFIFLASEAFFLHLKTLKSTPKCPKLTFEVLKVKICSGSKCNAPQKKAQNRPLGNYRVCPNSGN
jgi:hypothetical protein